MKMYFQDTWKRLDLNCTDNTKHTLRVHYFQNHILYTTESLSFPTIKRLPSGEWEQQTAAPPGWVSERCFALGIKAQSSSSFTTRSSSWGSLEHPPYTHDYGIGLPIYAKQGYTDSIMAKQRKDRDSWGECTYNICYFTPTLTHIFFRRRQADGIAANQIFNSILFYFGLCHERPVFISTKSWLFILVFILIHQ